MAFSFPNKKIKSRHLGMIFHLFFTEGKLAVIKAVCVYLNGIRCSSFGAVQVRL